MAQEISEIDRQRAANIAEKEALMKKLELAMNTQPSTPFKRTPAPKTSSSSKKTTPVKPVKEETPVPRRTSARLAGITADSDVAKRKAEQDDEVAKAAWEAKRRRVSGDLNLGDIMVSGQKAELSGLLGNKYETTRYERTFGDDDVNQTTDKDLKSLREKMSGLILWDKWEPNRIKITPERVYCMAFHPSEDKPLVFSGDKMGNLGILDASQPRPKPEKDGDEEEDDPDPAITTLKPHTRTISGMHFHYASPSKLYMASYDSSIRALDLEKSIATEVYAPPSTMDDEPIASVDMAPEDNQTMYFTTLNGAFGYHDMRTGKESPATIYQLSDKKIGGFSLYPTAPHYFATASLDRTMKLWDLRQLSSTDPVPVGEHESSLSVSHAAFSSQGHVVTSSYDNSLKIYNFGAKGLNTWGPQHNLGEDQMNPDAVVRHNCQTGRWVTILRPQWQACPSSGIERFCIGNMNRFVDIYAASGDQLAQLGGDHITAVPAVAVFHPTQDWIVGGTASGKACLWM